MGSPGHASASPRTPSRPRHGTHATATSGMRPALCMAASPIPVDELHGVRSLIRETAVPRFGDNRSRTATWSGVVGDDERESADQAAGSADAGLIRRKQPELKNPNSTRFLHHVPGRDPTLSYELRQPAKEASGIAAMRRLWSQFRDTLPRRLRALSLLPRKPIARAWGETSKFMGIRCQTSLAIPAVCAPQPMPSAPPRPHRECPQRLP